MSERRSWDVQPRRRAPARSVAAPVRERASVDKVRAVRVPGGKLRERRRQARKKSTIILGAFFLAFFAVLLYVLWLPQVRVQNVAAEGPRAEEVAATAREALAGRRFFVLPRNSIFLLPKRAVRETVLSRYPEISALSISRSSFSSLVLRGTPRASAFIWCGTSRETAVEGVPCFETDVEGLVFKEVPVTETVVLSTGSSTPISAGDLRIYAPLDREVIDGPVGAHVVSASLIPDALRFVKAVRGLGVPIVSLELRGDEADLWVNGSTRITYVLGREEEAAQLAASVLPNLTLTNGTIQYLDLRFSGKAYVKRYGE